MQGRHDIKYFLLSANKSYDLDGGNSTFGHNIIKCNIPIQ